MLPNENLEGFPKSSRFNTSSHHSLLRRSQISIAPGETGGKQSSPKTTTPLGVEYPNKKNSSHFCEEFIYCLIMKSSSLKKLVFNHSSCYRMFFFLVVVKVRSYVVSGIYFLTCNFARFPMFVTV